MAELERGQSFKADALTALAPGEMPDDPIIDRATTSAGKGPDQFIFKKMREKTRGKTTRKKSSFTLGKLLSCLTPDPIERAGIMAGKVALKTAVDIAAVLQAAASLDPVKIKNELKAIISNTLYSDLSKYEYKDDVGQLPGRLTSREMIYCARLSLIAYLTKDTAYDQFFPEYRENEILKPMLDEGGEGGNQVHRFFMIRYVASLFEQNEKDPRFGYAKGMANALYEMNLELFYPFNERENEGYIAISKDFVEQGGDIVIAFQGTVDRADFITNFKGALTPFEPLFDRDNAGSCACIQGTMLGCCLGESAAQKAARASDVPAGRVHLGFYEAFLSVRRIIQSNLEFLLAKVVPNKKPIRIVVTGHSLGGAIATLCTAWLMQWFKYMFPGGLPETVRVLSVTFGQPKIGNDEFVHSVDSNEWTNWSSERNAVFKTYRIFTAADPVVTTPPVAMGFRHCYAMCLMRQGHLYFLPQSMANEVDTTSEGLRRAIDQGFAVLHFHDLFNYLHAVMHFADATRGDQDMDQIFGAVDYEADVRHPDFFKKF